MNNDDSTCYLKSLFIHMKYSSNADADADTDSNTSGIIYKTVIQSVHQSTHPSIHPSIHKVDAIYSAHLFICLFIEITSALPAIFSVPCRLTFKIILRLLATLAICMSAYHSGSTRRELPCTTSRSVN